MIRRHGAAILAYLMIGGLVYWMLIVASNR